MDPIVASILTIGTEVSSGQIVNSNAAWVANQLTDLKINPVWHLTVPDLESEILDALELAATRSQLLFITGGLGPTTDDITRQIVSRWWGEALVFQEASWQKIQHRFAQLGIEPPESNRQQCYFPKSARILDNPAGTADAFHLQKSGLQLWCLPGPPEEIKAIWHKNLAPQLADLSKGSDAFRLYRWHLLGKNESAIGEIVESIIAGSHLISGYRPHAPYIEVKIWCRVSEVEQQQDWLDRLDSALAPWLIGRDDEDSGDLLLARFQSFQNITVHDFASRGAFADRLGSALAKASDQKFQLIVHNHYSLQGGQSSQVGLKPKVGDLVLTIQPLADDGTWIISWHSAYSLRDQTLTLPYRRHQQRSGRDRKFICEMSLAAWCKCSERDLYA